MSSTVKLRSCASRPEAEFLKSLLEENGIHAMIMEDNYIGVPLMTSGGVQLLVMEEDAERAEAILQEDESQD